MDIDGELSARPDHMQRVDHGGLDTSKHAQTRVHPEGVVQVSIVRRVCSPRGERAWRRGKEIGHVPPGTIREWNEKEGPEEWWIPQSRPDAAGPDAGDDLLTRQLPSTDPGRSLQGRMAEEASKFRAAPPASYATVAVHPAPARRPVPVTVKPDPRVGSSPSHSLVGSGFN
jgi:hypothetical protein